VTQSSTPLVKYFLLTSLFLNGKCILPCYLPICKPEFDKPLLFLYRIHRQIPLKRFSLQTPFLSKIQKTILTNFPHLDMWNILINSWSSKVPSFLIILLSVRSKVLRQILSHYPHLFHILIYVPDHPFSF